MNEEEEFIPPTDEQVKEFLYEANKVNWSEMFLNYEKQLKAIRKAHGEDSMEYQVVEQKYRKGRKVLQDAFFFTLVDYGAVEEEYVKIKALFDDDEKVTAMSIAPFFVSRKKRHLIGKIKPVMRTILDRYEKESHK